MWHSESWHWEEEEEEEETRGCSEFLFRILVQACRLQLVSDEPCPRNQQPHLFRAVH